MNHLISIPLSHIPGNLIGTNSQKWTLGSQGILIVRYRGVLVYKSLPPLNNALGLIFRTLFSTTSLSGSLKLDCSVWVLNLLRARNATLPCDLRHIIQTSCPQ